jgi:predicted outer membrane repeat protein
MDPGPSSVTVLDTTFTRNSAAFAGGALASLGELNFARLTFTANTSGGWGGALFYNGYDCDNSLTETALVGPLVFHRNVAEDGGGAIYVVNASAAESAAFAISSVYRSNRDRTAPYSPNYYDDDGCPP